MTNKQFLKDLKDMFQSDGILNDEFQMFDILDNMAAMGLDSAAELFEVYTYTEAENLIAANVEK